MESCACWEFARDSRLSLTSYDHFVRSYFLRIECSFRSWRREKWIIIWQSPVCRGRLTGWSRGSREQYWLFTNAETASLRLWIHWEQTRVIMDTWQYEVSILEECRSLSMRGQLGCRSLSIWRSTYSEVVHRYEMNRIYINYLYTRVRVPTWVHVRRSRFNRLYYVL